MALRPIRILGEPVLRRKAKDVERVDSYVIQLLNDMADTMYQNKGIGLAANQIGVLKKVVVIDVGEGLIRLINPKIIRQEGKETCTEACLSVPNTVGEVERAVEVTVKAIDEKGKSFEISGKGLLARVFQHEIDHLYGRLYIDTAQNVRECTPEDSEEDGEEEACEEVAPE
jgi:peptide deformylase